MVPETGSFPLAVRRSDDALVEVAGDAPGRTLRLRRSVDASASLAVPSVRATGSCDAAAASAVAADDAGLNVASAKKK